MKIRGFEQGPARRWGRLTVWPLYGQRENVGFVRDIELKDDRNYGSMGFTTDHPGGGVAPFGWAVIFGDGQDRATREAIFVPQGETVYADSVCLEPAQSGLWRGQDLNTITLPLSLQAAMPAGGGYSVLWSGIKERSQQKHSTVAGLLEGYQGTGRTSIVPAEARGALVTLDGRLVAVEIAPNPQAFKDWWTDFGLADALAFEAATMPSMPLPLGILDEKELRPEQDGIHQVTFLDVLKGWLYANHGRIVYGSLVDGEALTMFQKQAEREPAEEEFRCP